MPCIIFIFLFFSFLLNKQRDEKGECRGQVPLRTSLLSAVNLYLACLELFILTWRPLALATQEPCDAVWCQGLHTAVRLWRRTEPLVPGPFFLAATGEKLDPCMGTNEAVAC